MQRPARPSTAQLWEASLVGALLGLAVLAWFATGQLAEPSMRLGLLTGAGSGAVAWAMGPSSMAAMGLFLVTWTVMMVAMMVPAILPVVATVHRWAVRTARSRPTTIPFVAGYLLVWAGSGLVVHVAVVALAPHLPAGGAAVRVGASVLVLSGLYQFTQLKDMCLRQCRSPLAFVAQHAVRLRRGGWAGMRVGAVHGVYCLGCCWTLMIVLVLLGMMSLSWMAAVAGVIFVEKVLPRGRMVGRLAGLVLVGVGIILFISPQSLPVPA